MARNAKKDGKAQFLNPGPSVEAAFTLGRRQAETEIGHALMEMIGEIEEFMEESDEDFFPTADVNIMRLPHAKDLPLPAYHSEKASGVDLAAAVPEEQPITLAPGARALVPTGLVLEIEAGFEGQIRPRSGLALKHGVTVLNSPGTIDADYRGEIQVLLINLGEEPFVITRGDRIAQLVLAPVLRGEFIETIEVVKTARGAGGFGSTGTRSARKRT